MEKSDHTQMSTRSKKSRNEKEDEKDMNRINLAIPQYLMDILPIEKWNSLPPQHQQECIHILQAPNTFFYRSRPSWEVAKFGSLSKDEEQMFFDRLTIFKQEYGITNSLWGYFAIPFLGRVGYQMASFYRAKVKDGTIQDPILEKDHSTGKLRQVCEKPKLEVSSEIHEKLSREAAKLLAKQLCQMTNLSSIRTHKKREIKTFEFIRDENSTSSDDSLSIEPMSDASTDDESFNTNRRRPAKKKTIKKQSKPKTSKKSKTMPNREQLETDKVTEQKPNIKVDIPSATEPKQSEESEPYAKPTKEQQQMESKVEREIKTLFDSDEDYSMDIQSFAFDIPSIPKQNNQTQAQAGTKEIGETFRFNEIISHEAQADSTPDSNRINSELTVIRSNCILVGARDPLTGRPMKNPAMNFDGYVMDYESWVMFLNGKVTLPYDTSINSVNDLIQITSENYDSLKMNITNFTTM